MVEKIEELSPEFEANPLRRTESSSLEYCQIKIDDALLAKARDLDPEPLPEQRRARAGSGRAQRTP